jgi:hypothetical protein
MWNEQVDNLAPPPETLHRPTDPENGNTLSSLHTPSAPPTRMAGLQCGRNGDESAAGSPHALRQIGETKRKIRLVRPAELGLAGISLTDKPKGNNSLHRIVIVIYYESKQK